MMIRAKHREGRRLMSVPSALEIVDDYAHLNVFSKREAMRTLAAEVRRCHGVLHAHGIEPEAREWVAMRSRHPWLCRWWLRTRKAGFTADGGPVHEFYVPWWGWPLELLHRAIFGHARLDGGRPEHWLNPLRWITRRIPFKPGEKIPKWAGVCFHDPARRELVIAPLALNVLLRAGYEVWLRLLNPPWFKAVNLEERIVHLEQQLDEMDESIDSAADRMVDERLARAQELLDRRGGS